MNEPATDLIAAHHELEALLYRLRLLRDLGDPKFDPKEEDAILDEGEALWYRMSEQDRRILEAERAAHHALSSTPRVPAGRMDLVDVELDHHARRGLPLFRMAS